MQVVGFNLTKILAEKLPNFNKPAMSTKIEFIDQDKEKSEVVDGEIVKLKFRFSFHYGEEGEDKEIEKNKQGEMTMEGTVLMATNKDEAKEFTKSWKKQEIPKQFTVPLYNFIMKRCAIKAVPIQDEVGLPITSLRVPQVRAQPKE